MDAVRSDVLSRARAAGVSGLLLAGVDVTDWRAQAALVAVPPTAAEEGAAAVPACAFSVACAYGIHPQVVEQYSDEELAQQLDTLACALQSKDPTLPRPHAVGELGLDALTPQRRQSLPRQERIFRAQLALARQHDVPLVLHILRTHGEALRVLRQDGVPRAGGVVHSYSGSADLVRDYVALGLSISFSGAITLPQATRLQRAACVVPLDRLLIETDAPDQTPLPHRPAANEPAFLPAVCAAIAAARSEDFNLVARSTAENARRLFLVHACSKKDSQSAAPSTASGLMQPE